MKGIGIKLAVVALLCAGAATGGARAQDGVPETLDARLSEATLRVDYIFSGTDKESGIAVDELNRLDGWAGRRRHMQDVPLRGNGQVCMTEAGPGDTR